VRTLWRVLRWPLLLLVVVFVAIQFVPYGWKHSNPPVTRDAPWPDAESERLARVACYDCHSNETDWPLYAYVAPMSWLVRHDVESGRDELNFSEWDDHSDADDAAEEIENGSMPPRQYKLVHPDARLSDADRAELIAALEAMDDRSGP
jgi:Haem-binding domain